MTNTENLLNAANKSLDRIRDLVVLAANDTTVAERDRLNNEIEQLTKEINALKSHTA